MVFKSISGAELCKLFCREYFCSYEGQNGSHIKIRHISGAHLIIPAHKEVKIGTFNALLSQMAAIEKVSKMDIYKKLF